MNNIIEKPDFETLDLALQEAKAQLNAPEVHGFQAGVLCVSSGESDVTSLNSMLWEELCCRVEEPLAVMLKQLCLVTQGELESIDFQFMPLLPDDEFDLAVRAEQLSAWCRSFLSGMACVGSQISIPDEGLVKEAIEDIAKFTALEAGEEPSEIEEDEQAYQQIVEFIRVAVQTIYIEIRLANRAAESQEKTSQTVH